MTCLNSTRLMKPLPSLMVKVCVVTTSCYTYSIEHFESLSDLILRGLVILLPGHHVEEHREVHQTGPVLVDLIDHVLISIFNATQKALK